MVSYSRASPTEAKFERYELLDARLDREIDMSDIPVWTEEQWKNAQRGFYRQVKQQITARADADVVAWLKSSLGKGLRSWDTRINAILRREMLAAVGSGK